MFLLSELVQFLNEKHYLVQEAKIENDVKIKRFASLVHPSPDALCWAKKPLPAESIPEAAVLVCLPEQEHNKERKTVMLHVKEPRRVFGEIVSHFNPEIHETGISDKAIVSPTAEIGENVYIGPGTVIGEHCKIGNGTIIDANVTLYHHTTIGKNCHISSGAVIGADGHGYVLGENNRYQKIRHMGNVVIGDNVDIGANSCVDRGVLDDTTIGDNTKIDNLVQVAHNVVISENCMITCGALICGSSNIGANCYLAPGCIIKNGVMLAGENRVDMNSTLSDSYPTHNTTLVGTPAKPMIAYHLQNITKNQAKEEYRHHFADMSNDLKEYLSSILQDTIQMNMDTVTEDTLQTEIPSINLLQIIMALDEKGIAISFDKARSIRTLGDLIVSIESGKDRA